MITCQSCGTSNLDSSRFCDECGARLIVKQSGLSEPPLYVPPAADAVFVAKSLDETANRSVQVTSVGLPPLDENGKQEIPQVEANHGAGSSGMSATLTIERGDTPGVEFRLHGTEAIIGRWDADNGIFPDVDLDHHDTDAKVSRRHARIKLQDGNYMVEDLGSTNGTYVNRGRRLLPGNQQILAHGDEVIVGKTFLRFHILNT